MVFFDIGWQLYLILFSLMVLVPAVIGLVLLAVNKNWLKPVLWSALSCTCAFLWTAWWFNHNQVFIQDNSMTNPLRIQQLMKLVDLTRLNDQDDAAGMQQVENVLMRSRILREGDDALAGQVPLVANPIKFSATPPAYDLPPPTLGQHTVEVLRECGLDAAEIERLRSLGAV